MNIFVLDNDPWKAAENMCDKHVVKMIIESAQILSAVVDVKSGSFLSEEYDLPKYPKAHVKHPCTIWSMTTRKNAEWVIDHLEALSAEYSRRYKKQHKLGEHYQIYRGLLDQCKFEENGLTPFAQAMPDEYKSDDPVQAYRTYYLMDKGNFAKWKLETPQWYKYGRQIMLKKVKEDSNVTLDSRAV